MLDNYKSMLKDRFDNPMDPDNFIWPLPDHLVLTYIGYVEISSWLYPAIGSIVANIF